MTDAVRGALQKYPLPIFQGLCVLACVALAVVAARSDDPTALLLMSLIGGGLCSAWIFHTSAAGRKTRAAGD